MINKKISVKVRVVFNRKGNTLDVWFGDPASEALSEETGEEIILEKDGKGQVIGFEKLNFMPPSELKKAPSRMPVEVIVE